MIHIPEQIIQRAIKKFCRKFMLIYPEKAYTDEDILSGSEKPTGKTYYGICTACGARCEDVGEPPNERDKKRSFYGSCSCGCGYPIEDLGYMVCPNCSAEVEKRKGYLKRTSITDKIHLMAWSVEDKNKVILYEANLDMSDFEEWDKYEGPKYTSVWDERKTTLTPGNVEMLQYRYYWGSEHWTKLDVARVSYATKFRDCVLDDEQLASSFISPLALAVHRENSLASNKIDLILRFVEEPLTELFYKAGFKNIAHDRVYKGKPTKGSPHIDFTVRSPKKMFRGLSKNNAEIKMKQLMKLITRKSIHIDDLEFAAALFVTRKSLKPEEVAKYINKNEYGYDGYEIYRKITEFPFERIAKYIKSHTFTIYRDYVRMAYSLGEPLNERKTAFPDDLRAAHDALVKRQKIFVSQKLIEQNVKRKKQLISLGYEYEKDGICAIVPADPTDIKKEGTALSHCVGSYAEAHARGNTTIIFIRRTSEPEKSWFTLEVDTKTLNFKQCYGYGNRVTALKSGRSSNYNAEVGNFLKHYKQHLKDIQNKKEMKKLCRKTA